MNKSLFKYICFIAVIFSMGLIFHMSNQSSSASYKLTGTVITAVNSQPVTQNDWDQRAILIKIYRKIAHIAMYGMLGFWLSSYIASKMKKVKFRVQIKYTLIVCVIYGLLDEIHQYFIPGRGASMIDVFWDTMGSAIGIFLSGLLLFSISHFHNKRKLGKEKENGYSL